jgi:hypothetical protein
MKMNEITKPYPSWVWDEETLSWVTPNGKGVPGDGKPYTWDEATLNWIEVPQQ